MSKFQPLNIISILALLVILTVGGQVVVSMIVLAVVYLFFITIGSIFIRLNFYTKSLNRAQTSQKQIAITFDDGPDLETTPQVLALLEKHKVKAAFFALEAKLSKKLNC